MAAGLSLSDVLRLHAHLKAEAERVMPWRSRIGREELRVYAWLKPDAPAMLIPGYVIVSTTFLTGIHELSGWPPMSNAEVAALLAWAIEQRVS